MRVSSTHRQMRAAVHDRRPSSENGKLYACIGKDLDGPHEIHDFAALGNAPNPFSVNPGRVAFC